MLLAEVLRQEILLKQSESGLKQKMPYKDPSKRKYVRPRIAVIDKTTPYDTLTRAEWEKYREEEYQNWLKKKEEKSA